MYTCFTLGTALWLTYGLLSSQYPVAVANAITFVFAATILIYKNKIQVKFFSPEKTQSWYL